MCVLACLYFLYLFSTFCVMLAILNMTHKISINKRCVS